MNRRIPLLLALLLALPGPAALAVPPPIGDVMAGEFALQQGDIAAATRYYLLAAQVSPDPAVAERATRIALVGEQLPMAERALARWRALAPDSPALRSVAMGLALRQGEHETAMDEARGLLSRTGGSGFEVLVLVLSEARGDEAVIARSVMRELFELQLLPDRLVDWLRFAGVARRLGDRPFSDKVIEAGLVRYPDDPRAQLLRVARLREAGEAGQAREQLFALRDSGRLPADLVRSAAGEFARLGEHRAAATLLAQGPQDDASLGQRAAWLVEAGDQAGLGALYEEAQVEGADSAPRALLLGHVAEALERWSDAERWYAGVARGAGHDLAMLRLARVQYRQQRLPQALDTLHELQADSSADGERVRDSYLVESELLEIDGRRDAAVMAMDRALAIFEGDPQLLYARAMLHERNDDVDAALADLRTLIDENPRDAQALNAYGYTLAERRQKYAQALPYVQRAHALEPKSAPILDSLGWVEFRLGRSDVALEWLSKAWSQLKDAEIAAHLGEVLWTLGRRDEARAIWREGAAVDPENPALKRTLETFRP